MGEAKGRAPVAQERAIDPGPRPERVKAKIVARLLLDGGTVERPRAALSLELPPLLKLARWRRKPGR